MIGVMVHARVCTGHMGDEVSYHSSGMTFYEQDVFIASYSISLPPCSETWRPA